MFTIFIYSDVKHSKKIRGIESSGFSLPGDRGSPPNYTKICSSPPHRKIFLLVDPHPDKFLYPNQVLIPPLNINFHVINPIETSSLLYCNFILSVNPSHANFDFNVTFNIYRMLLLSLKKLVVNSPHLFMTFQTPRSYCLLLFLCTVNADFVMVYSILKLRDNLEQKVLKKF